MSQYFTRVKKPKKRPAPAKTKKVQKKDPYRKETQWHKGAKNHLEDELDRNLYSFKRGAISKQQFRTRKRKIEKALKRIEV